LGRGIISDTLLVKFATAPPGLNLVFGLSVTASWGQTLHFTFSLLMDEIQAKAKGSMEGWWIDPFRISSSVKIGPRIAMEVDIIFAEFIETGLPSGLAIAGGLAIGSVEANLAIEISETDPTHNLLVGSLTQTGVEVITLMGILL
jgi:hypothetical protein